MENINNNITVIIPIHKYDEDVKKYFTNALDSVYEQIEFPFKINIVAPKNVIDKIKIDFKGRINLVAFIINDGEIDYCSQVNLGVKNCSTKYFSVLAFDDSYNKNWFKNFKKYSEYLPEYSIYLPIVNLKKEGKDVGKFNEIIWAMSFSNELGVIDEDILQSYYDFSTCGGVFRTDDFIEVGMLKPSIKLTFWYEFLLRAVSKGIKIYVIPKNGYFQNLDRTDSILADFEKTMDTKERSWWIKLATKEHYYTNERKKSYTYVEEKTKSKELSEIEGLK